MASILTLFNRLLPFATPGTPLLQDAAHLAAICLLLYFAPQIQDRYRHRVNGADQVDSNQTGSVAAEHNVAEQHDSSVPGQPEADTNAHVDMPEPAIAPEVHVDDHAAMVEDEDDEDDDQRDDGAAGGPVDRSVGAKKAKSLARKDQRRAYNEFMRSQGEAQRAKDAEGASEREAALEAEKKRRALAEAELAAKKAHEQKQKREAEQAERDAEYQRRDAAVAIVKADLLASNISDLHKVARQVGGDVDEEWVEKVIQASGIVGRKNDVLTMITTTGWAARINENDARAFYERIATADLSDEYGYMNDGKVSEALVSVLSQNVVASSA